MLELAVRAAFPPRYVVGRIWSVRMGECPLILLYILKTARKPKVFAPEFEHGGVAEHAGSSDRLRPFGCAAAKKEKHR